MHSSNLPARLQAFWFIVFFFINLISFLPSYTCGFLLFIACFLSWIVASLLAISLFTFPVLLVCFLSIFLLTLLLSYLSIFSIFASCVLHFFSASISAICFVALLLSYLHTLLKFVVQFCCLLRSVHFVVSLVVVVHTISLFFILLSRAKYSCIICLLAFALCHLQALLEFSFLLYCFLMWLLCSTLLACFNAFIVSRFFAVCSLVYLLYYWKAFLQYACFLIHFHSYK